MSGMGNRGAEKYGRFYWCVGYVKDKEIYVFADEVKISSSGDLLLWRIKKDSDRELNLSLAKGVWTFCYAASVLDGAAVAAEHWKGQIEE